MKEIVIDKEPFDEDGFMKDENIIHKVEPKVTDSEEDLAKALWGQNEEYDFDPSLELHPSDEEFLVKDEDDVDESDFPMYEDLTIEEIENRQKEFANMSDEEKRMFGEITGSQNTRDLTLHALIESSYAVINEADEDIEDIEFSEKYLEFMNWYEYQIRSGMLYTKYEKNVDVFEEILNQGLKIEDPVSTIFELFTKKELKENVKGTVKASMSGLEYESLKRFEKISTTDSDLVEIFVNIPSKQGITWEEFSKCL